MNRRPETQQKPQCEQQRTSRFRRKGSECRNTYERIDGSAKPGEGKSDDEDADIVENALEQVDHDVHSLRTAKLSWRRCAGSVITWISAILASLILKPSTTDKHPWGATMTPTTPLTSAGCANPALCE